MGFDLNALRAAVAEHGSVARVVVASIRGSSPREVGAAMLVWATGQSGTIGGGALEYQAAEQARSTGAARLTHHALGPELGQCCGGAVTLLTEIFDARALEHLAGDVIARPAGRATERPMPVRRVLSKARNQGVRPVSHLVDGWMVEPVHRPDRPVWVWGAGHVGRAIVDVLAPLPDTQITWIDTARDRFPDRVPEDIGVLPAARPATLAGHAPAQAEHLILTYSHALDLEICHALLNHSFAFAGLIGSATKWARFRSRLRQLGHADDQISRITCPIGDPDLGKHPQTIAIGVASAMLRAAVEHPARKDVPA